MRICIPILARTTEEAVEKMRQAGPLAEMLEIRLDVMERFDLDEMVRRATRPVIVSYRSKKEGGQGRAHYATRVRLLREAIKAGAEFVDMEFGMPSSFRETVFRSRERRSHVILSRHFRDGTPSQDVLEGLLRRMVATGAAVIKIVAQARKPEDNIRMLDIISTARSLGVEVIAFCMGTAGRISRVMSPLLGGYLTFASLTEGEESAEGQMPARIMRDIITMLQVEMFGRC